uniref:Rab11 family-interacting protein 5 n=1 Tax=Eptatretus burgeri TaxID=7764 RepID=A0A8C4WXI0_EPTBU
MATRLSESGELRWVPTHVQVTVLQARGLKPKGKHGTNDAFAVIQLGTERFSTSVLEKSREPDWREECAFDLPPDLLDHHAGHPDLELRVTLFHRALLGPDRFLGHVTIDLPKVFARKARNKSEWFPLLSKVGKKAKERGELQVSIQFMRHNLTASMFDLSGHGKPRSTFGKFKDKVRGKKKGAGLDSASAVVPSSVSTVRMERDFHNEEDHDDDGRSKEKNKSRSFLSLTGIKKPSHSPSSSLASSTLSSIAPSPDNVPNVTGISTMITPPATDSKTFPSFGMPDEPVRKRTFSADVVMLSEVKKKSNINGDLKSTTNAVSKSSLCINGSHVYVEKDAAGVEQQVHKTGGLLSKSLQNLTKPEESSKKTPVQKTENASKFNRSKTSSLGGGDEGQNKSLLSWRRSLELGKGSDGDSAELSGKSEEKKGSTGFLSLMTSPGKTEVAGTEQRESTEIRSKNKPDERRSNLGFVRAMKGGNATKPRENVSAEKAPPTIPFVPNELQVSSLALSSEISKPQLSRPQLTCTTSTRLSTSSSSFITLTTTRTSPPPFCPSTNNYFVPQLCPVSISGPTRFAFHYSPPVSPDTFSCEDEGSKKLFSPSLIASQNYGTTSSQFMTVLSPVLSSSYHGTASRDLSSVHNTVSLDSDYIITTSVVSPVMATSIGFQTNLSPNARIASSQAPHPPSEPDHPTLDTLAQEATVNLESKNKMGRNCSINVEVENKMGTICHIKNVDNSKALDSNFQSLAENTQLPMSEETEDQLKTSPLQYDRKCIIEHAETSIGAVSLHDSRGQANEEKQGEEYKIVKDKMCPVSLGMPSFTGTQTAILEVEATAKEAGNEINCSQDQRGSSVRVLQMIEDVKDTHLQKVAASGFKFDEKDVMPQKSTQDQHNAILKPVGDPDGELHEDIKDILSRNEFENAHPASQETPPPKLPHLNREDDLSFSKINEDLYQNLLDQKTEILWDNTGEHLQEYMESNGTCAVRDVSSSPTEGTGFIKDVKLFEKELYEIAFIEPMEEDSQDTDFEISNDVLDLATREMISNYKISGFTSDRNVSNVASDQLKAPEKIDEFSVGQSCPHVEPFTSHTRERADSADGASSHVESFKTASHPLEPSHNQYSKLQVFPITGTCDVKHEQSFIEDPKVSINILDNSPAASTLTPTSSNKYSNVQTPITVPNTVRFPPEYFNRTDQPKARTGPVLVSSLPIHRVSDMEAWPGDETEQALSFASSPHPVKPMPVVIKSERQKDWYDDDGLKQAKDMVKQNLHSEAATEPLKRLSQAELVQIVLSQREELAQRDSRICDLQHYIDDLLLRVINETPHLLLVPYQRPTKLGQK